MKHLMVPMILTAAVTTFSRADMIRLGAEEIDIDVHFFGDHPPERLKVRRPHGALAASGHAGHFAKAQLDYRIRDGVWSPPLPVKKIVNPYPHRNNPFAPPVVIWEADVTPAERKTS